MALRDKIKTVHAWNGLSCAVCSRGQSTMQGMIDGCDLEIEAPGNDRYCALFVAHEGKFKTKRDMAYAMEQHVQRWIREKIAPGL